MRTVVHVSDLHFGRLDPRLVSPMLAAINRLAPDLVAVSGDVTHRARRREFESARLFLQALRSPALVVPGNHDVPFYDVVRRFVSPLGRYRRFVTTDLEPVHTDDEMVVLGLNSSRSLTFGRGRLNERQVRTAVERLRSAPAHATRIIVTHHPFDLPARYGDDHLVGRASMAMAHLAAVGADLFLAGHLHVTHIGHTAERYKIAGHSALVVQAGTMSTRQRGEPNSFNVLRISRPHLAVTRQTWDTAAETFVESAPRRFVHTGQGWAEE